MRFGKRSVLGWTLEIPTTSHTTQTHTETYRQTDRQTDTETPRLTVSE